MCVCARARARTYERNYEDDEGDAKSASKMARGHEIHAHTRVPHRLHGCTCSFHELHVNWVAARTLEYCVSGCGGRGKVHGGAAGRAAGEAAKV
ncbi:hypothetical protein EON67_04480 [archaeon]|nr:MAG: hypothetical protein EON67_04480 [archaeon]